MGLDEKKKSEIFNLMKKENQESSKSTLNEAGALVKELHSTAVVERVRTDEEYQKKFFSAAAKTIDNELYSLEQESIKRKQVTTYDSNSESCENYGINQDVELWKIKLMKVGSGFWFVIYWLFASLTIAPLNVFFKGIRPFVKNNFVVFLLAVLAYLIIVVGIPIAIAMAG